MQRESPEDDREEQEEDPRSIASAEDWESEEGDPKEHRSTPVTRDGEAAVLPAQKILAAGTLIAGRYRVRGTLGEGGFGVVYDAEHVELGRSVALKVLRPELTESSQLAARFQQEARAAASIGHPNIVEVFDLGLDSNGAFIAMEKLEGEELAERITRAHPLPEAFVARIGAEVADAMAAAHERGIVHRDLKPQNVFLAKRGRTQDAVKVIDFGIAKLLHRVDGELTKTGQLFGTPRYMAPEQLRGAKDVDARVDVYAIGAILYQALTGALPYEAETYAELVLKIMVDKPAPIAERRPDVTPHMIEIVGRALAKQPEDRWESARELADVLFAHAEVAPAEAPKDLPKPPPPRELSRASVERFAAAATPPPRRTLAPWIAVAVLVIAVAGAAVYAAAWESGPESPAPEEVVPREADPPPAPSDPVAPRTVHFETEPPGATIRVAGAAICVAPCSALITTIPAVATAELDGFETAERFLPDPPPASVRLVLAQSIGEDTEPEPARPTKTLPPRERTGASAPPLLPRFDTP